jgi:hypothetical protein
MNANDRSTLYDLADKQDRFEHEYSSELVTRIGLFLVFAGFVSGVAIELLKLTFAGAPSATAAGRYAVISLLAVSILFLFVAMVWLLLTAFIPGYSVPGKVNDYRAKYKKLLDYRHGDHRAADADLRD